QRADQHQREAEPARTARMARERERELERTPTVRARSALRSPRARGTDQEPERAGDPGSEPSGARAIAADDHRVVAAAAAVEPAPAVHDPAIAAASVGPAAS